MALRHRVMLVTDRFPIDDAQVKNHTHRGGKLRWRLLHPPGGYRLKPSAVHELADVAPHEIAVVVTHAQALTHVMERCYAP